MYVSTTLWHFLITAFIFGSFFGFSSPYCSSLVGGYKGSERLPFTLGMMGLTGSPVVLIMPPALSKLHGIEDTIAPWSYSVFSDSSQLTGVPSTGFFKDQLNDYRLLYLAFSGTLFLTSLPLIYVIHRRKIARSLEVS